MSPSARALRPTPADVARMSAEQLDALEAAIKERRKILRQAATRLPRLEERRAALAAQLQEVESAIAVFTGEPAPKRKPAKPASKRAGKSAAKRADKPARSRKAAR